MTADARPTIVTAITVPISTTLIRGQLRWMARRGFRPVLICSPGSAVREFAEREGVEAIEVPMAREIRPWSDLVALWRLVRCFRRLRPALVNAGTPKAGFLGILAAWITRVPCRIYTLRGLRHERTRGWLRRLLLTTERVTTRLAHRVICVSPSLLDEALADRLLDRDKAVVIGRGSSNGIDTSRFRRSDELLTAAARLRERYGVPPDALVVGCVSRLVRTKGIVELVEAWRGLREAFPTARLFLVGPEESGDPLPEECLEAIREDDRIVATGFVTEIESVFALLDVLVLPALASEGFPNVLIQAAAMEVPVVATDTIGCRDAVADGVNGTLVPRGDARALEGAIEAYLGDGDLRARHGAAGREWVEHFSQEAIWSGIEAQYRQLLAERAASVSRRRPRRSRAMRV